MTFGEWIASLPEDDFHREEVADWEASQHEQASEVFSTLQRLGCKEPGPLVVSEVSEKVAQSTQFAFLKGVTEILNWNSNMPLDVALDEFEDNETLELAISKVNESLSEDECKTLVAAIGKFCTSQVIYMLDEGYSSNLPEISTGWSLQECSTDGELTGRSLSGLHESDDGDEDEDFLPKALRTPDD
ncbi:MAG: hypothetical protein CMJ78_20065 [Planctomycetaceae bacterium]|nr:hypothetical protein [Planctomycetaceae bacterium]